MILIVSIVAITLALVFYTLGVFSERKRKKLEFSHVIIFWIGFICDSVGTLLLKNMSESNDKIGSSSVISIHGITGALAIILMLFHATWATVTFLSSNHRRKANFHKFSLLVWIIWLVPYIIGMILAMA